MISGTENSKTEMLFVALAGPIANLLMAIFVAITMENGFLFSHENIFIGQPLMSTGFAVYLYLGCGNRDDKRLTQEFVNGSIPGLRCPTCESSSCEWGLG